MTAGAAPLAELVQALAPPLDYLAADDFRQAGRTRLPLGVVRARLARARDGADAATGAVLDELADVVAALADGAGETALLLRRAHALLPRLREASASAAAGAWPEYHPTTGDVGPALASLDAPVATLPAVGPKRARELERFGLQTVEDVLYHLPFRYEDHRRVRTFAELRPGEEATTVGEVASVRDVVTGRRGRPVLEVVLQDATGTLACVWFHQLGWFRGRFGVGQRVAVRGRVELPALLGPPRMVHPDATVVTGDDDVAALARIVPVYEKPTAMPAGVIRRIVHAAVATAASRVPSAVPPDIAARQRLVDPGRALRHLHDPPDEADVVGLGEGRSLAHRALVFDELFFLQLGLALRRSAAGQVAGRSVPSSTRLVPALRARLPFQPTAAQERAIAEIAADLAAPHPMRRLLQGDVGSGKTLVALVAALGVIDAGYQAAIMAPTELLAEQHCDTIRPLVEPLGVGIALLTGGIRSGARRQALAGLASGTTALAVGTHALIQEGVAFARLGLAVVDEQHRFGVLQRAALGRQGEMPVDVLVMSATPIPRTLALTLYGDLAISTLDELPPGRTPIRTALHREARREGVYERIRSEVQAGHQAYVVYPLVEESEKSNLRAATTMADELAAGPLAGLRVGLVHGRMKPEGKDAVMRAFKAHAYDVLVSTTVIEVGIDVPNATVMVVEHAERFGLAQLHQLRGRVGRGRAPGHCLLVVPDWMAEETFQRLAMLERSTDGFRIAEADLALRGPGDFLGTRQAGLPPFRVANLLRDADLLRAARDEALAWLADDPALARPASHVLRAVLAHRWRGRLGLAGVG